MQRKSSIHIDKGNLGYCFHNTRQKSTTNSIFSTENNAYDNDAMVAMELYKTELNKREKAYTLRTGRKLHKNTITHLSAIVNLDERHTLDDVKKVAKYLEDTLGTKVFQIALHKDEGYVDDETNEKHINYHAHIEMLGLDEQGNSVRRKLTRSYLINLQSKVAEMLNMQRGINYTKEKKKRPKRLDTYEYKEYEKRKDKALKPVLKENKQLKEENEELKLTKKELEKQISELRKKMIEFNKQLEKKEFTQEDYKYLSALKKALKANNLKEIYEKLKEFDKNISDRMLKFKEYTKKLEEENKELKNKLTQSENRVQELEEEKENLIKTENDSEIYVDVFFKNDSKLSKLIDKYKENNAKIELIECYINKNDLKEIKQENKNIFIELKKIENLHNRQAPKFNPYDVNQIMQKPEKIEEKIYICKILNKRLDFFNKKLNEIEEKLDKLINKIIEKESDLAVFFKKQTKTQLKQQTKNKGPKI